MSYNNNNYSNQNQNKTKLADPRFTLYGKFDESTKKSAKLKFMLSQKKNGEHVFKISVYSAEGKGGSLEIPYTGLMEIMTTIGVVARKTEKCQYRWGFNIFNPQTRKPDSRAIISVGKDDAGIVYMSVRHPLEFQQAVRLDFRPNFRFALVDREDKPRTDGEASSIVAANWASLISTFATEEFNRTWQFQEFQRKGNGGGGNNYGNNNGGNNSYGGNNNNNGGNSYDNDFDELGF